MLEISTEIDDKLAQGYVTGYTVVAVLVGAMAVVLLVGAGLYRHLVDRRLRELGTAMDAMTQGNIAQQLDDRGSDELSQLASGFNAFRFSRKSGSLSFSGCITGMSCAYLDEGC